MIEPRPSIFSPTPLATSALRFLESNTMKYSRLAAFAAAILFTVPTLSEAAKVDTCGAKLKVVNNTDQRIFVREIEVHNMSHGNGKNIFEYSDEGSKFIARGKSKRWHLNSGAQKRLIRGAPNHKLRFRVKWTKWDKYKNLKKIGDTHVTAKYSKWSSARACKKELYLEIG